MKKEVKVLFHLALVIGRLVVGKEFFKFLLSLHSSLVYWMLWQDLTGNTIYLYSISSYNLQIYIYWRTFTALPRDIPRDLEMKSFDYRLFTTQGILAQGTFFDHYISINLFYIFNDFWYWFESLRNSLLFILSSYGLEGYYVKSCNLKVSAVDI